MKKLQFGMVAMLFLMANVGAVAELDILCESRKK
jgi:hypothetical protein